jgi:hypothetical protein
MNLIESILSANDGKAVAQIAKKVGIPEASARKGVEALAPSLQRGLQRNTRKPGGADDLLKALRKGDHAKYVDKPETLESDAGVTDGNNILGHIFGSKDVSRNVAGEASGKSGIDADILKKMLPMLGAVAMGAMAKQTGGGTGGGGGLMGSLGGLLGKKKGGASGSPMDALGGLLGGGDSGDTGLDDILDLG